MIVFMETLRRGWRGMIYWGLGVGLYGFIMAAYVQDADMLKQYAEIANSFPPALLKLFGGDAAMLATPEGFLAYGFFGFAVLILAVYAILSGLNISANDEDSGVLDVVLSLPLPRWRLMLEKFAAYSLLIVGIIVLSLVGLMLGNQVSAMPIEVGKIIPSMVNVLPSVLLILAFSACAGGVFHSKGMATAVSALFVVVSYLLNFLGELASSTLVGQVRALSFFRYYDHNGVVLNGLSWGNILLLIVAATALVAVGLWGFQRRDVGT